MQESQLMKIKAVARELNLPDWHARRLVATKVVPGFKIGRTWRVRPEDLQKWITDRVTQP